MPARVEFKLIRSESSEAAKSLQDLHTLMQHDFHVSVRTSPIPPRQGSCSVSASLPSDAPQPAVCFHLFTFCFLFSHTTNLMCTFTTFMTLLFAFPPYLPIYLLALPSQSGLILKTAIMHSTSFLVDLEVTMEWLDFASITLL